jgi:hypothetical protein
MRSTVVRALFVLFLTSSVLTADDRCSLSLGAIPFCAVASDLNYDNKEITVRGLYRMVIHGSVLTGAKCPNVKANVRLAPDYKVDKKATSVMRSHSTSKKDQFEVFDVILRGTFHVAHEGQCYGQNCESYELETRELLCAQKPKPEEGAVPAR